MALSRPTYSLRRQRGAALMIALAIAVGLTVVIIGTQFQVAHTLKESRADLYYERSLTMAEAGMNAYLNGLIRGAGTGTNAAYIPTARTVTTAPTISEFHDCVANSTQWEGAAVTVTKYPAGGQQGYWICHQANGTGVTIYAYGWCNGIVRRIRAGGSIYSIFDWAALWGINPSGGGNAWNITGGLNVVGGFGGEGQMSFGNNNFFYDGPGIAAGPNAVWASGTPTSSGASSPNVPPGHVGNGVLASPFTKTVARGLAFPTADAEANNASGTSSGVEYFRTHNNNQTGIRLLVKNKTTNAVRELTGSYTVIPSGTYTLSWPAKATYTSNGMSNSTETEYGLAVYPGDYFWEQVNMSSADVLVVRSYNDYDRTNTTMTGDTTYPVSPNINSNYGPANPNGNDGGTASGPRNVRFWIGHRSTGSDLQSLFKSGCSMAYSRYPSRFRCYVSSTAGVDVRGNGNSSLPAIFNVNMLVYNITSGVSGGPVTFSSGTYLRGSLIAWNVTGTGGATVEKSAVELGTSSEDRLIFLLSSWSELP